MTQALFFVAVFLVLLALLPSAIKWLQRRSGVNAGAGAAENKIVSAIAVGPHQRVVTVEVGPAQARVVLVLGVTNQSVTCLHSMAAMQPAPVSSMPLQAIDEPGPGS